MTIRRQPFTLTLPDGTEVEFLAEYHYRFWKAGRDIDLDIEAVLLYRRAANNETPMTVHNTVGFVAVNDCYALEQLAIAGADETDLRDYAENQD